MIYAMMFKELHIKLKALLLTLLIVFSSVWYVTYETEFSDHHCDDPSHCVTCLTLNAIAGDHTPLLPAATATIPVVSLPFVVTVIFSLPVIIRSTLVSLRVKKTE